LLTCFCMLQRFFQYECYIIVLVSNIITVNVRTTFANIHEILNALKIKSLIKAYVRNVHLRPFIRYVYGKKHFVFL